MMDYTLLMRRVMAQLALVGDGATVQVERTAPSSGHPSKLLTAAHKIEDGEGEIVYVSLYWLQAAWTRAHSTQAKARLVRIALGVLRLARVRTKAKEDTTTQEGRLAIGREALATSAAKVAGHYGYSVKSVYEWMDQARRADERTRLERERLRYDGTLNMRCLIAATPGTAREVGDTFGVSHSSVLRWRRDESIAELLRWEAAIGETADDPLEDGDGFDELAEHLAGSGL